MTYFGPMKTLIIHPEDSTTTFLSQIYAQLTNKTVIRGGKSKSEIPKLIESHDRVLMLGHGSPWGLLNAGQFPDADSYIIDYSMVIPLKCKSNSIFIWCNANQFVQKHGLAGLSCGMFISEVSEADYYGFDDIDWDMINQSNERFASIISMYLNEPIEILYQKLLYEYGYLARTNPIARFNLDRLYLTCLRTNKNSIKVVAI
jgi:hypothetical protein